VSKGSRQNRSVPLVKRLALRIGQLGIVLETGFSIGGKNTTSFSDAEVFGRPLLGQCTLSRKPF